jgi:predicted nucleic acid-binding protein
MSALLIDTNIVSILFKPYHTLYAECFDAVRGHQSFVSFMTRSEILLWPKLNNWGERRREELSNHLNAFTTLFPDEETCVAWSDIIAACRAAGRPLDEADAWIAATARQWSLPLLTANQRHFDYIENLTVIPIPR